MDSAVLEGYVDAAKKRIRDNPNQFIHQCQEDVETCTSTIRNCTNLVELCEDPPEGFDRDKSMRALASSVIRLARMQKNLMSIGMIVASSEIMFDKKDAMRALDDLVTRKKAGG